MDIPCILKMKKNKTIKKVFFSLAFMLLIFIFISKVNAVGVSSPYWDEYPLIMQPGEVKEFNYLLQNMVGNDDIKIKAELESGTEIMEFLDTNMLYDVPLGRSDVPVRMRVTVPSDAEEGDEYQVGVRFTTITEAKEGAVSIGVAYSKGFRVVVGQPKTSENIVSQTTKIALSSQLTGLLILLAILIILILAIKYFHKKNNENKNA